jgi:hypothetical protein
VVNPRPLLSFDREIELSPLLVLLIIGKSQPRYHQPFTSFGQTVLVNFRLRFRDRRCKMKPTSGARPMLLAGVQAEVSISADQISSVPNQTFARSRLSKNRINRQLRCPYFIFSSAWPCQITYRFSFLKFLRGAESNAVQQTFKRKDREFPAEFFLQPAILVLGAVDAGYAQARSLFCGGCRSSGAA